jgi:Mn-dependent DtxR family transcriptional regulator
MADASAYLIVIYAAERDGETPVAPGRIADAVGRSPAATTEMLQRLEDRGLVVYEPYEGAELTAQGRVEAADLHETYRTLSQFFREVLDIEAPESEAMELAGSVSPLVTERLSAALLAETEAPSMPDPSPIEGS